MGDPRNTHARLGEGPLEQPRAVEAHVRRGASPHVGHAHLALRLGDDLLDHAGRHDVAVLQRLGGVRHELELGVLAEGLAQGLVQFPQVGVGGRDDQGVALGHAELACALAGDERVDPGDTRGGVGPHLHGHPAVGPGEGDVPADLELALGARVLGQGDMAFGDALPDLVGLGRGPGRVVTEGGGVHPQHGGGLPVEGDAGRVDGQDVLHPGDPTDLVDRLTGQGCVGDREVLDGTGLLIGGHVGVAAKFVDVGDVRRLTRLGGDPGLGATRHAIVERGLVGRWGPVVDHGFGQGRRCPEGREGDRQGGRGARTRSETVPHGGRSPFL